MGMQQRVEILKMLYRDNEILILDEPTAVLTPQEIDELMEIMQAPLPGRASPFCSSPTSSTRSWPWRTGARCCARVSYMGTVEIQNTTKEELSRMMVGRDVNFVVEKKQQKPRRRGAERAEFFREKPRAQKRCGEKRFAGRAGGRNRVPGGHRGQRPDGIHFRADGAGKGHAAVT